MWASYLTKLYFTLVSQALHSCTCTQYPPGNVHLGHADTVISWNGSPRFPIPTSPASRWRPAMGCDICVADTGGEYTTCRKYLKLNKQNQIQSTFFGLPQKQTMFNPSHNETVLSPVANSYHSHWDPSRKVLTDTQVGPSSPPPHIDSIHSWARLPFRHLRTGTEHPSISCC